MRVLITGATGFLGSHVAEAFVRQGCEVAALVRPAAQTTFLQTLGVRLHTAQSDAMKDAEAVVHAVAKVHTHGHWRDFRQVTIEGTRATLDAAARARVPHFIHISSVGVYGWPRPDGQPYDETCGVGRPYHWNYYSRAKIEAERLVRESSIPFTILRPTWVYGPRDAAGFGAIINALRHGRLKLIGDGNNRLSLVYVTDVAQAVLAAATNQKSRGEIFNVAADETCLTQKEFIALVCQLMDLPHPTARVPYRLAHAIGFLGECVAHATGYRVCPPLTRLTVLLLGGQRRFSNSKLRRVLGWQPTVGMEEGVRRTAQAFALNERSS